MTSDQPSVALIVPCYNEAAVVSRFVAAVSEACAGVDAQFVIIAVDDGSNDGTFAAWRREAERPSALEIRALRFSRNFGKEVAISAGLHHCDADAAIIIDVDLQDPPELIPELVACWREGFDSVVGVRRDRQSDGWFKRASAAAFYGLMPHIADIELPAQAGDFRLLSRRLVEAVNAYGERARFMKGLFASLGFRQKLVYYDRPPRTAGRSRFSLWRLWNFALDGITSFSSLPLRIWSYFGFVLALLSFLYALFIVLRTIIFGVDLPGYASIIVSVFFFAGIQLISIGVLGEYIGRIFTEVKRRPMYLVESRFGFDGGDEDALLPPQPYFRDH